MKCQRCGIDTNGSVSAGGITWAVCDRCMETERRELEQERRAEAAIERRAASRRERESELLDAITDLTERNEKALNIIERLIEAYGCSGDHSTGQCLFCEALAWLEGTNESTALV